MMQPQEKTAMPDQRLSYNVRAFVTYIEAIKNDKINSKKVESEIAQLLKEGAKPEDLERKIAYMERLLIQIKCN